MIETILVLLMMSLFACGHGGKGESTYIPVKRAPNLIGYSLPNGWHLVDPEGFAQVLGDNGLTFTEIEWSPFIDAPKVCGNTTNATFVPQAQKFVQAMRAHGITTFVNIVNANGCAQTNESTEWFMEQVGRVVAMGPVKLAIGGVSEPWAYNNPAKMKGWEIIARQQAQGLFIAPANGQSNMPYWSDIDRDYLDSHPCSMHAIENLLNRKLEPKLIANTDCSPLLNPGPQVAAHWTRLSLDNGTNLAIYDFGARTWDEVTIRAMGAEIQK